MTIRDLGEFGLIERLVGAAGVAADDCLIVGPGDDAAVWRSGGGYTIATTDTMVAGVHFLPDQANWRDVGWKALASNVSDIAAMGGTPTFALVTLCLPPDARVDDVDALHAGMLECAEQYGVTIAGGDIVSSDTFTITVALLGEAAVTDDGTPPMLRRNAARPGDAIAVTGPLGGSAGGLRALLERAPDSDDVRALIRRHMRPQPRVDAGRAAVHEGVRCGMDISDGLVQDLGHICAASGLGAGITLSRVPLEPALVRVYGDDAPAMAASGGEDYELLLIAPPEMLDAVQSILSTPLAIIGAMHKAGEPRVRLLDDAGAEITLPSSGWDHFAPKRDAP